MSDIQKNIKFTHTKHGKIVRPSTYFEVFKNAVRFTTKPTYVNVSGYKIIVEPEQPKNSNRMRNTSPGTRPRSFEVNGFTILIEED